MEVSTTDIDGCFVITPKIFKDARGHFLETFNEREFANKTGVQCRFVQDNQSCSKKGTLRGLHLQSGERAQSKLVRVTKGKVMDVMVDLRKSSPSFMKIVKVELSEENFKQVFAPKGCAHGFLALSQNVEVQYKCDEFYAPQFELGIRWNDPALNIDWGLSSEEIILSDKDKVWPELSTTLERL